MIVTTAVPCEAQKVALTRSPIACSRWPGDVHESTVVVVRLPDPQVGVLRLSDAQGPSMH